MYIKRAIHKYGRENFSIELLEECNIEDLNQREQYWIKKYDSEGVDGLIPKTGQRGNRFSALYNSKDLPEMKKLQLQIAQLQIEVERLKKGYVTKGVGVNKEFVTGPDKSTKSSKH